MSKQDLFLKLFLKNEQHLFNFILMLAPNYSDAEDLLQESASTMWSKFDSFEQGTNFMAWARQIARFKVSNYYRSKKIQFRLDEITLDALSEAASQSSQLLNDKKAALTFCLKKLQPTDRELLQMRYFQRYSIPTIAKKTNRSPHTLYRRMSAIYLLLQNCVRKAIIA